MKTLLLTILLFAIGYIAGCNEQDTGNLQEYQIRIEMDSAYIYDNGRLVGSCAHGSDGIDSVILKDNL